MIPFVSQGLLFKSLFNRYYIHIILKCYDMFCKPVGTYDLPRYYFENIIKILCRYSNDFFFKSGV